ncbi:MAG: extracellular solute-binding protein [Spirochaetaceae bacterium]|nr:extracellular solute-binding protein [Spirochaetaceae bacterium]
MKKIVTGLACLICLAGCKGKTDQAGTPSSEIIAGPIGQVPIVKEKLTYTLGCWIVPNWGDPAQGEFWKNWEQETNIHINWIVAQQSEAADKFSIMMSSGDYPDGFIGGWGGGTTNILRYGVQQGIYLPITKLIPENMPHFMDRALSIDPAALQKLTAPDGQIYSLPNIHWNDSAIANAAFINKTWLDKLGLPLPKSTDEFRAVLQAFKTQDPNGNGRADEIPFTFKFDDWGAYDHTSWFGAFGYPLALDFIIFDKGKAVFQGTQPGYRKGVEYFAELYKEGLIDREVFTMTEQQIIAKENLDPMTIGAFSSWANYSTNHYDDYTLLLPLRGPEGDQNWGWYDGGFLRDVFIITQKAKNPEFLLRWADQFYRNFETSFTAMYGLGPDPNKYWNYDENHIIRINPTYPAEYERGMQQLAFPPVALEANLVAEATGQGLAKDKIEYFRLYSPYIQKFTTKEWEYLPSSVFMTEEENEELSVLETELVSYTKNQLARWISGDANINADWDKYLKELNTIGLDKYVELKQKIFNRFKGN